MFRLLTLACLAGTVLAGDFTVKIQPRQNGNYPPGFAVPTQDQTPQVWLDALAAATAAGKIPNIAPSTNQNGAVVYANNAGNDPSVCSWTVTKCVSSTDIVNAPDNHIAVAFDDGPTGNSGDLYDFLNQNNQSATHFLIGSNVLSYPQQFGQAVQEGNQHLAVHTWSHQLCSTLTNQQLVAELGWTMQIIADYSGGYIPKFWRPPQGDIDNRVRAIAEEIFGLVNVLWNHDTNDWCLNDQGGSACPTSNPGKDYASVAAAAASGVYGTKSPGLIMLEHELTHASISVFKNYYPNLKSIGWTANNIADLFSMPWYKNAWSSKSELQKGTILQDFDIGSGPNDSDSSTSTSSSSTASSSTTSASSSTTSAADVATSVYTSTASAHIITVTAARSIPTSNSSARQPNSASVVNAGSLSIAAFATVAALAATLL